MFAIERKAMERQWKQEDKQITQILRSCTTRLTARACIVKMRTAANTYITICKLPVEHADEWEHCTRIDLHWHPATLARAVAACAK